MARITSNRFLSWLLAALIQALCATVRVRLVDPGRVFDPANKRGPVIYAFWHNQLFMMPYIYKRFLSHRKLVALISPSRDGQILTDIMARFGMDSARGSSSKRGSQAMRELIARIERDRADVGITPDGPRGPKGVLQPGVLHLARATGCPIVVVRCELGAAARLPSWDRFQIPLPFTRCRFLLGPQVVVGANEGRDAETARHLTELMGEA